MNLSGRRARATLGEMVILGSVIAAIPVSSANAQELHHGSYSAETSLDLQGLAVGIAHGATLAASVFLVGLVMFVVLVWLPASGEENTDQRKALNLFCRWMCMLFGLLVVAGLVEIPLYAVRASGEGLSPGLLVEALFGTRVGQLWIERILLAIVTVTAATYAADLRRRSASMANLRRRAYSWGAAVLAGILLLMTLTQQSHAAADGRLLPFAADWLHVIAASLWMGGLLGFPILLLGPLRVMSAEMREKLLARVVPRFSKVATIAVMGLILTGLVAILLHVPRLSALLSTSYGRALTLKLGLVVLLLAIGGLNLIARGRGPFGRRVGAELILALGVFVATGFLTSLPPADVTQQDIAEQNIPNPTEGLRQPPMPDAPKATGQSAGVAAGEVVVRVSGTPGIRYSGIYGTIDRTRTANGTLEVDPTDYEVEGEDGVFDDVSAAFQKTQPDQGTLKVEIVAEGEVVAQREVSEESGTAAVS